MKFSLKYLFVIQLLLGAIIAFYCMKWQTQYNIEISHCAPLERWDGKEFVQESSYRHYLVLTIDVPIEPNWYGMPQCYSTGCTYLVAICDDNFESLLDFNYTKTVPVIIKKNMTVKESKKYLETWKASSEGRKIIEDEKKKWNEKLKTNPSLTYTVWMRQSNMFTSYNFGTQRRSIAPNGYPLTIRRQCGFLI